MGLEFHTSSAEETVRAGELLGGVLRAGDVIALAGDLGAGKTQLVKGVACALGVDEPVTSPTFNLLLVHPGAMPLYHFDLYRLECEDDLEQIGFYEILEADGASLIEWGDRFPRALPGDHLLVVVHRVGEDERRFELLPAGARAGTIAREWTAALHGGEAGR